MKDFYNFNHDRLLPNFIGFDDLFNAIDDLSKQPLVNSFPPYDIYSEEVETAAGEKETHYVMQVALAGIPREEIKASFKDGVFAIWNEKKEEPSYPNRKYTNKGIASRCFRLEKRIAPELELSSYQLRDGIFEIVFKEKPKTPEDDGILTL